jgi:hypothetical protein
MMADNLIYLKKKLILICKNDDIKFNSSSSSKFIHKKKCFCVKLILLLIATLHAFFECIYTVYRNY